MISINFLGEPTLSIVGNCAISNLNTYVHIFLLSFINEILSLLERFAVQSLLCSFLKYFFIIVASYSLLRNDNSLQIQVSHKFFPLCHQYFQAIPASQTLPSFSSIGIIFHALSKLGNFQLRNDLQVPNFYQIRAGKEI